VAFAAEPVPGVDQRDLGAEPGQPVGVQAGLDVALDDPDPDFPGEPGQGLAQQRGLARALGGLESVPGVPG
jgi:hypothetical protein